MARDGSYSLATAVCNNVQLGLEKVVVHLCHDMDSSITLL